MENYSEEMTDTEFLEWIAEVRRPFEGQLSRIYIDVVIQRFERLREVIQENLKRNAIIWDEAGFKGHWVAIPDEAFNAIRAMIESK